MRISDWSSDVCSSDLALIPTCLYLASESLSLAMFIASAGVTASMNGLVTLRQGLNRASGRLIWGQAPNELFRPFATIVGYAVAASTVTSNISGAFATLHDSALTIGLIIFSPPSARK